MVAKVLQRPTLVLNRNWQPVNVATVARALVLLWNESARIVDPADYQTYTWEDWSKLRPQDGERFIQAVRIRLRVPEVLTLSEYDRFVLSGFSFELTHAYGDNPEIGERGTAVSRHASTDIRILRCLAAATGRLWTTESTVHESCGLPLFTERGVPGPGPGSQAP